MGGDLEGSLMGRDLGGMYPVPDGESEYGGHRDGDYLYYDIRGPSEDETICADRGGGSGHSVSGSESIRGGAR